MQISIIGAGNIGSSIAKGLTESALKSKLKITVTRRKTEKFNFTNDNIIISNNNHEACKNADIIIICVQPSQLIPLLTDIKNDLKPEKQILVSTVAGVSSKEILSALNINIPLFRVMPNTAIAHRESMTCISTTNASHEQFSLIESLFNELGITVKIDDELIDSATVLAACGIAYAMRFIRAASQGGIEIGFDAETAHKIAAQTTKGAASLLLHEGTHPEKEIDKVTTPKGCTITGLNEMEHQGFSSALIKGLKISYNKISDLKD